MLAWSEKLITDVRKPEIMVMTSLWAEAIYWLLRSPTRKLVTLNPKLKSTGAGRPASFFPCWDAYRKQLDWKTSLRKVRTVALQQIKERGALPMIDRGDIRQAIDRCSNIWASLPGAGYGQFEHKADSLIAKIQRSGRNSQRDWCMSRVTAIISALVILSSILSWAVNHYREMPAYLQAQRDKNARELKLANAAITDMQMRQRGVTALDAKYTKG